jgi:hypothetical protein
VNPAQLTKGISGGSYAHITIHPRKVSLLCIFMLLLAPLTILIFILSPHLSTFSK